MTKPKLVIYWSWRDLRLGDNPALTGAVKFATGNHLDFLPIFILDDGWAGLDKYNIGYPRRALLSKVLSQYATKFKRFEVIQGEPLEVFKKLHQEFDLYLFVNNDLEPYAIKRHAKIRQLLGDKMFILKDQLSINKNIKTKSTNNVYSVFTPFKNAVWDEFLESGVLPEPDLKSVQFIESSLPSNLNLVANSESHIFKQIDQPWVLKYGLCFSFDLDSIFNRFEVDGYTLSEQEALARFHKFMNLKVVEYSQSRDDLGSDGTSQMSTALAFGLVSARQLKDILIKKYDPESEGVRVYISELLWREFYRYILYHFPHVMNQEFQERFSSISWVETDLAVDRFQQWIKAQTGYPLVDAAMKQIVTTGWMHNRTRMVVGSILTKNLGVDWRWGQDFFRSVLVDLDEASNNGGWQWSASTGADPKPIRIFNPYSQERYDPQGVYRQKWLDSGLYKQSISGKGKLVYDYKIEPIVPHEVAREEARIRYGL